MENILVSNPYECILIYIDNTPSATTLATNAKKVYNYADYVTTDKCLVTTESDGVCTAGVSGTLIPNCQFYSDATHCSTCLSGFAPASDKLTCVACSGVATNCATCTHDTCLSCVTFGETVGSCNTASTGTNCFTEVDDSGVKCS